MPAEDVNYVDTYFDHKKLTPISGEPTFQTLKDLKDELRANAASVPSDLGGGLYGHLGLVLSATEYAQVTPHAYIRPADPGVLTILHGTPVHDALRQRDIHDRAMKKYKETLNVERALKAQIVEALDPIYIKTLKNPHTKKIHQSIPDILTFLFTRYGEIDDQTQSEKETEVRQMSFHPADPLVAIFTPLEDLREIGTYAANPYSEQQLIRYGLEIIKRTHNFETYLKTWYTRPQPEHTWVNFKAHFEEAQRKLKKVRGTQMQNSNFHSANSLVEEVRTDLNEFKHSLLAAIAPKETNDGNRNENIPPPTKCSSVFILSSISTSAVWG